MKIGREALTFETVLTALLEFVDAASFQMVVQH